MSTLRSHSFASLLLAILGIAGFSLVLPEGNLVFEMKKFSRYSEDCVTDDNRCVKIEVEYPLVVKGPRKAMEAINDSMEFYVRRSLMIFPPDDPAAPPASLDEIATRLLSDYEEFSKENPTPWTIETKGEVQFQNKNVVSIKLDNFTFTGGAHPNSYRFMVNFSAKNGKVLRLEEVVTDIEKLKVIVESKFREHYELPKEANLNEEGFFWDEPFGLARNFAVVEKGLYFYYNPYEVAAYAVGATEVLVPYEELEGILTKKIL